MLYLQVTFEQHKENLSRVFRQYQHQDSAGSVRTISGVSQSMEHMESVNGSPTEESAPSTVIELTVDSPSGPAEASGEAEPASGAVSDVLRGAGEEEQKLEEEANVTGAQANEKRSKETDEEQPEMSTEESHPQTLVCDGEGAGDRCAVEMAEGSTAGTLVPEDKAESGPSNAKEGSTTEESELPSEDASCLESSALGGASVFNEDLVDVSSVSDQPSDADDSQEESSSIAGPAEEEVTEEDIQHEQEEGEEMKDEKQKNGAGEKTEATATRPVERDVTETPKDADVPEQSSATTPATPADRTSETTAPLTAQEVSATAASTSDRRLSGAAATAEGPTTSEHGTTAASTSGKTKEIEIARLDVSSVASDTVRFALKETVGISRFHFIFTN